MRNCPKRSYWPSGGRFDPHLTPLPVCVFVKRFRIRPASVHYYAIPLCHHSLPQSILSFVTNWLWLNWWLLLLQLQILNLARAGVVTLLGLALLCFSFYFKNDRKRPKRTNERIHRKRRGGREARIRSYARHPTRERGAAG